MSIAEKLTTIAENEQKVYETGKTEMNEVWWIAISNNYSRTAWGYAFQYADISNIKPANETIKVKSDITRMFQSCKTGDSIPNCFDFSGATHATHAFRYTSIKVFTDLGLPAMTALNGAWQGCRSLETIEIIRCTENSNWSATFSDCPKLKDVTFEGVIGENIYFGDCSLLSRETLLTNGGDGVFGKLKDYSGTGTTHTITLHADTKAMLTDAEKAIATQKGWTIS